MRIAVVLSILFTFFYSLSVFFHISILSTVESFQIPDKLQLDFGHDESGLHNVEIKKRMQEIIKDLIKRVKATNYRYRNLRKPIMKKGLFLMGYNHALVLRGNNSFEELRNNTLSPLSPNPNTLIELELFYLIKRIAQQIEYLTHNQTSFLKTANEVFWNNAKETENYNLENNAEGGNEGENGGENEGEKNGKPESPEDP